MAFRMVLDTNVLVSGFRSRRGSSFRLLSLLGDAAIATVVSVPLVLEYEAVLKRQASAFRLSAGDVNDILDFICEVSEHRAVHFLWRPTLRDPRDEFVLELAVEGRCQFIVTHNVRDFEGAERFNLRVVTPKQFFQQTGGHR